MEEWERDPKFYLQQLNENLNEKGKLKIFFGYAAGIGKTYAMLEAAQSVRLSGTDVVIGYIEPHSRPETMALTAGLEQVAPLEILYHEIKLREFDLDAVLRRKPQVVLVDELAHSNAHGCRHAKRYQDIKELLQSGIDVYTTVNVQHLESLNDIITGITGILVRERIPDYIFDDASQVELVDLEPSELIERLKAGKVYKEAQADRAVQNFFVQDNLVSLREIALRRMADRVNKIKEKNRSHFREEGSVSQEHVLVCLSPSPSNEKVIRQAARLADAFHGKLTAFYVETDHFLEMSKPDRDRLANNIHLAEQLGARIITNYGSDIVSQIAEYVKIAKVSKVVLGRTYSKRSLFHVKESFSEQLAGMVPQLEIFLVPDSYDKKYMIHKSSSYNKREGSGIGDTFYTLLVLAAATGVSFGIRQLNLNNDNIIMVYLLGVVVTSLLTKERIFSFLYSLICVFVFNFFFVNPVLSFTVNDPSYIITFVIMFLTAFFSSSLTQKIKNYAKQNARKSYRMEILLETSQKLQQADGAEEIMVQSAQQLGKLLERTVFFFLGNPEEHPRQYFFPSDQTNTVLNKEEIGVAAWTYKNSKHAGFSTETLPGSRCLYLAVRNGETVFAVVGIDMRGRRIPAFEKDIMAAILNESALALEKEALIRMQSEREAQLKQEKLRADLLRSISHDLRTPLTSISGNAGILIGNSEKLTVQQKMKLYDDIYDDSIWLINLVENLLSVTRIENGSMNLNLQPELVSDVIDAARTHIGRKSENRNIQIIAEDEMIVAKMDARLMIQVIVNLVDNALKYTPLDSDIVIRTRRIRNSVVIEVCDHGPGIPEEQKEKIFDMFYTGANAAADGHRGMGIGLALCKSIVSAHGGRIQVEDNTPNGTVFRIELTAEEVWLDGTELLYTGG